MKNIPHSIRGRAAYQKFDVGTQLPGQGKFRYRSAELHKYMPNSPRTNRSSQKLPICAANALLARQTQLVFCALFLFFASAFAIAATPIPANTIQHRYKLFHAPTSAQSIGNDMQRNRTIVERYTKYLAPFQQKQILKSLPADDVELLFRAAAEVEFYTHQSFTIIDMTADLWQFGQFGKASNADLADFYRALIDTRDFSEADSLWKRHLTHALVRLPPVRESADLSLAKPSELVVTTNKNELLHRSVDLPRSSFILVIGHPLCHFTQEAMRSIVADPKSARLFSQHALWLAPQDGGLAKDFNDFAQWNRHFPNQPMGIVYKQSEWPMIDSWETPTFYFVKNGSVRAKVVGWPEAGNMQALRYAAHTIGLGP